MEGVVVLAPLGAVFFPWTPAQADDATVAAQLQHVVDAYVRERGQIEGFSGAALQVDRGGANEPGK